MKKYWFKAKHYGWGWYPSSWQGWLVLAIWMILLVAQVRHIDSQVYSDSEIISKFIPPVIVLTVVLILICYITGEPPSWRWGKPKS